jgi:hypothetical protein
MVVEMKILSGSFMRKRRSDKNYINLPWLFWLDNAKKGTKLFVFTSLFGHYLNAEMEQKEIDVSLMSTFFK